jgi:hypothetical protein
MARIASLLLPYYEKETAQVVRDMEADDWAEGLSEYPRWAVERAVRWWKGKDNPKRRQRPVEGDIAARCQIEMRPVMNAKYAKAGFSPATKAEEEKGERVSDEARERIMAEAGLSGSNLRVLVGAKEVVKGSEVHKAMQSAYTALISAITALKKRNPQDLFAVELEHVAVKMENIIEKERSK